MSRVQHLVVEEGDGDQRLDRWFKRTFPLIGQGLIEKMCRKGDIRVDGGRVKASTRLEVGQTVRIPRCLMKRLRRRPSARGYQRRIPSLSGLV